MSVYLGGVSEMRQSRCGCWQTSEPKRRPWYYERGDWLSWKPVSIGGDEYCRWTLVLGLGLVTGVLVVPLWECRGCEDCGPNLIDGVPRGAFNSPYPFDGDLA